MADAVELNLIGKTNVDMNFDAINDTLSISDDGNWIIYGLNFGNKKKSGLYFRKRFGTTQIL